jgi:hypothetical protein
MMVAPETRFSTNKRLRIQEHSFFHYYQHPVSSIAGNKVQDSERLRIQEHSFFQYWHHT